MSIWKKLVTAVRGGASEVGESIIDANAIRILEQEQRDADNALIKARNGLIEIKSKQKIAQQRVEGLDSDIASWESKAMAALTANQEGLAGECAERVAALEAQRNQEAELASQFGKQVGLLQAQIAKAEAQLKGIRQQTEMAKARETVQQARVATANATGGANGKVETAVGSLARIKQRQDEQDARLEAAEEIAASANGADLDQRLQAAGIGAKAGGADDVLARLKARQAGNNAR
ncbi:PspA/IM30 family protein [Pseudomonas baltica]|uniref:PspA/IM30 family protein n=1 Tax=Pseudomonas baltica TaxID=2762576 RepID=UPI0028991958|nr:PspA/IM30 family protein [Pseudomonas baltica]